MGIVNRYRIFVLLFLFFNEPVFPQNAFYYEWYVVGNVRDGVLIYDKDSNQALYIDYLSSKRKAGSKSTNDLKLDKGEGATIVEVSTSKYDRYFYKKDNKINYTTDLLKTPFVVNDTTLNLKWTLESDIRQIDGFNCKKATVNFRGRIWEVWYTMEIPIYYGPWKFYGLPGLIVAAYESSNEFWFHLTKIKADPSLKIPVLDKKKFKEVSLKEYVSMVYEIVFGNAIEGFKKNNTPKKRNGIELIYEWEEEEDSTAI